MQRLKKPKVESSDWCGWIKFTNLLSIISLAKDFYSRLSKTRAFCFNSLSLSLDNVVGVTKKWPAEEEEEEEEREKGDWQSPA